VPLGWKKPRQAYCLGFMVYSGKLVSVLNTPVAVLGCISVFNYAGDFDGFKNMKSKNL
jgi:hypothetical protein